MPAVGSHKPQARLSGIWKDWSKFWARHNGSWKRPVSVHVRSGGSWVKVYDESPVVTDYVRNYQVFNLGGGQYETFISVNFNVTSNGLTTSVTCSDNTFTVSNPTINPDSFVSSGGYKTYNQFYPEIYPSFTISNASGSVTV